MSAGVELNLLEQPAVKWRGRRLELTSRRTLPLLAYVALEPAGASRSTLLGLLWESGRAVNLRQELAKIRKLAGADTWFSDDPTGNVRVHGATDLGRLREAFRQGNYEYVTDYWKDKHNGFLFPGVELDFLPKAFHEWLDYEEGQIEDLLRESFQRHGTEQERQNNYGGAIATYQQLVRLDPLSEGAHQAIIRMELASGNAEAARHQLDRLRQVFRRELGGELSLETLELAAAIPNVRTWSGHSAKVIEKPGSLPGWTNSFVGRCNELAELSHLFARPDCSAVSVTGMGGVGKTRLVTEFARKQVEASGRRVVYLPLASLERTDLVFANLALALGVVANNEAPRSAVQEHLAQHEYLLVFDNVEHLPDSADLIGEILSLSRSTKLITTSRIPLEVTGGRTYPLRGMLNGSATSEPNPNSDAVELFRQRALQIQPENLPFVIQICRLLDGLPLGIELAAGLTEYMTTREIARELQDGNYDLLSSDRRERPVRHRTLRTVVSETWATLSPEAQEHLARLSIFSNTFSRTDAKVVAGTQFGDLHLLMGRTLVNRVNDGLLTLPSLIRWFASEQLVNRPHSRKLVRKLHLLAAQCVKERNADLSPPDPAGTPAWLEVYEHLREAEQHDAACSHLLEFDRQLIDLGQAGILVELLLRVQNLVKDARLQALSLLSLGLGLARLGRLREASDAFEQCLLRSREAGDASTELECLANLGTTSSHLATPKEAIAIHEATVRLAQAQQNRVSEAMALGQLGSTYERLGDFPAAIKHHELALAVNRATGDIQREAENLLNLARVYRTHADTLRANARHLSPPLKGGAAH